MSQILWNSLSVPDFFLEDDDLLLALRAEAVELAETDAPSRSDILSLIIRYNAATPELRDAMDAALV